jgi:prepilin-type processing-associated H-X9-DG protein
MVTGGDMRTALIDREAIPLLLVAELMRTDIPVVHADDALDTVMNKFATHDVTSLCRASGKGMAIAGIVVGGLGLLGALITIPLMIAILLPAMAVARDAAMDLKSMENVREMTQGMLVLASSHDDEFPGADEDWQQVLITGAGVTPGVFESPSTDGLGADYFFVPVGKSMFDGSTVLIYEDPALDPSATIIGFADGHVEKIDEPRASMLLNGLTLPDGTAWTPHLSDPSAAGGRP